MNKTIATIGLGVVAFAMNSVEASAMEKGTINTIALNIRNGPSTQYSKIDKVYKDNVVEILEKSNGWYKVKLSNGTIGWGSGQYINTIKQEISQSQVTSKKGKVIANPRLNIRSGPGTNYSVITKSSYGEKVEILEKSNGWNKVKLSNGTIGWGSGDYIIEITNSSDNTTNNNNDIGDGSTTIKPPEINQPSHSTKRENVIKLAYELIGTSYSWGGNGPDSFDCSGFTKYVYNKAEGKNIPRVSRDQAKYGEEIAKKDLLEGDLVYFDTNGDGVVNHVGIYVGNNEFIHASGTPTQPDKVIKENLTTPYWTKVLIGARRF